MRGRYGALRQRPAWRESPYALSAHRGRRGHGPQRLSRLAAAAGPPRHRLTLNSTHRTQSQNTATNATHGHGLLRLGHRHRLPLPAQIKHLPQGGGDERPAVAVRARVAGDGSPIERTRSCCSRVGAARRASHPQIPRRTPSRGRGRAAGAARARREVRAALAAAVARAAAVTERGREGGGEQDTRAPCGAVAVLPHMPADSADGW